MALEVSRVLAGAHDDPILCVAYNVVRREVWTGCQGGKIRCWEEKTGEMVQEVSGAHKGWVNAMEYVRRHDYLVTCGVDGTMVCRTEKGKELQRVDARGALFCLAYGARRDLLVAGGRGAISVFRLVTINPVERNQDPVDRRVHPVRLVWTVPDVHADVIGGVACDASGRIFTGSYDRSVCVFDGEQFERMRSRDADEPAASVPPRDPPRYRRWAEAHDAAVSFVATDPANAWVLTGSYDGSCKGVDARGRAAHELFQLSRRGQGDGAVLLARHRDVLGERREGSRPSQRPGPEVASERHGVRTGSVWFW